MSKTSFIGVDSLFVKKPVENLAFVGSPVLADVTGLHVHQLHVPKEVGAGVPV